MMADRKRNVLKEAREVGNLNLEDKRTLLILEFFFAEIIFLRWCQAFY